MEVSLRYTSSQKGVPYGQKSNKSKQIKQIKIREKDLKDLEDLKRFVGFLAESDFNKV